MEVEERLDKCPLCSFPIPDIDDFDETYEPKFPIPENILPEKLKEARNTIYYGVTIVCIAVILILGAIAFTFNGYGLWLSYSISGIVALWVYVFFLLGYVKNMNFNLIGITLVTILLALRVDSINYQLTWSVDLVVPLAITALLIFKIIYRLYHFCSPRKKNPIFIVSFSCLGLGIYSLLVDIIINRALNSVLYASWSVIVLIATVATSILLLGLYYKLPDHIKEKLKRKFHL